MTRASVFEMGTVDSNSSNRETRKQDGAEPGLRPISLLSFLEAENVRLRQAIVQLSLDAGVLREALNRMEPRPGRAASIGRPDRPRPLSLRKRAKTRSL